MTGEFDVRDQVWQLKDRSASGCRLRGRIADSNRVLPGALVAFREHGNAAWTLAVVRRLRKRIGDRIDIGVEYVGQNPLAVNLAADGDRAAPSNVCRRTGNASAAWPFYLRESSGHPHMPFKTLILSPREFKAGRCLEPAVGRRRVHDTAQRADRGTGWLCLVAVRDRFPAGDRWSGRRSTGRWRAAIAPGRVVLRAPPVLPQPRD